MRRNSERLWVAFSRAACFHGGNTLGFGKTPADQKLTASCQELL